MTSVIFATLLVIPVWRLARDDISGYVTVIITVQICSCHARIFRYGRVFEYLQSFFEQGEASA